MNKAEVIATMTAIRAAYPNYYRVQAEIDDAINLWAEMLVDDKAEYIAKAVKEFIKTDISGFPPTIGQIRNKAGEIKKAEYDKRKRETDMLPEPEIDIAEMPEELKRKMAAWMRGMQV